MNTRIYNSNEIEEMIKALEKGGVIAFPTDTVFGLGCIYDNEEAISFLKNAKNRDKNKPLPMMCSSLEMVESVAEVSDIARKLIHKFCPGPLTLVFPVKKHVESYVNNGLDTIGIRIPKDERILYMINSLKKPLLVTSANLSGEPSLMYAKDVIKIFDGKIHGILDEDAKDETASTIVDTTQNYKILREGPISKKEIEEVL